MAIKKRLGAQDILNQCEPFIGQKSTFKEAFPEVAEIRVEYSESDYGGISRCGGHAPGDFVLTDKSRIGEYLSCSNPLCYKGGIKIGWTLREMIRQRETEKEGSGECQGNEASPKGRKIYRKCMNFFKYKITIRYHEETEVE